MSLADEFRKMVSVLTDRYAMPSIDGIFFPPFYKGGQPKDAEFMALSLEGGATGISYVLLPDDKMDAYMALQSSVFIGKNPREFALEFGSADPIKAMVSLAAINAICQHVMREAHYKLDSATDSLGLLQIAPEDTVGMVGLFTPLIKAIKKAGADMIILEKNEQLIDKYPDLPITLDASRLDSCNKILCTSTTVLNNSLDEVLGFCSADAFVSIIGPTAGYFPDPLFARGVDVVGGRVVKEGAQFLKLLAEKKRWGDATRKTCFQKATYNRFI